ncbi:hypothetical protein B5M10_02545 [Pluralibacter gergoviae]|uniref:hypothetical protein n=2 Tax=Pluralibacter gergoviae TaxID=61647 RepID=UPI0005ED17A2|nr:hypothetical protein [Pluralibacter gergoviae]KJM64268.1 hypothetical protein SS31_09855 [Pluralibacter gergoviae]OUR04386.1 hypothetical protein B5M10_02545 [Pluralibacter gergoviae]
MHCWKWHDFEDETEVSEQDEFERYNIDSLNTSQEHVARQFWAGSIASGRLYTASFIKVSAQSALIALLGEVNNRGCPLGLPESGAWVVTFDVADAVNNFAHIELDHKAKKDLATAISGALYDHYNITKAGLYCWYAARKELLRIYDTALGFNADRCIKLKAIPLTTNFNQLGVRGRGYAIITQYY